jgi:hypothetical protein
MSFNKRAVVALAIVLVAWLVSLRPALAGRCFFYSEEVGYVCDARMEPEPEPFRDPGRPEDSLFDHTSYAYLEDDINLYSAPDLAAPVARNVGKGFLYVTVHGNLQANGQSWYLINPGEYALAEDIRLVQTPEFRGVEVMVQPERPFGWIVQEVQPSAEPDGPPVSSFAKLERYDFVQVYGARLGAEEWIWYDIGGGRWIKQIHAGLVDLSSPPEGVGPNDFWTEVDLYEQTFAAYEGPRMVYATLISSGLNRWPTHEGLFQVWSRHTSHKMSGAEGKIDYYDIENVPYIMYFDERNEIALHGAYWHNRFGYKHSHGCVNMPPLDSEWVFRWSENSPSDLWVHVHTSDPMSYFDRFQGQSVSGSQGST